MASPQKYADADLALAGNCAVCRVELKQEIAGKPELTANHAGIRYQFPSDKQRKLFVGNPGTYAVGSTTMSAGSGTKAAGSGTR